jgi:hypothetical protein
VLLCCHAGCETDQILSELGISAAQLFPDTGERRKRQEWLPCHRHSDPVIHHHVASYEYRDATGQVLYTVTRCAQKCFAQWRPDPTSKSGKRWSINDKQGNRLVPHLPYRLPELLATDDGVYRHEHVLVCEGEKDCDRAWALGYAATCNSGGSGKWTSEHAAWLIGRMVTIVMDNDHPGMRHAAIVRSTLVEAGLGVEFGGYRIVRPAAVEELPTTAGARALKAARWVRQHGHPPKDLSDHLDAGLSVEDLVPVKPSAWNWS